jgi:hypothetical protein
MLAVPPCTARLNIAVISTPLGIAKAKVWGSSGFSFGIVTSHSFNTPAGVTSVQKCETGA